MTHRKTRPFWQVIGLTFAPKNPESQAIPNQGAGLSIISNQACLFFVERKSNSVIVVRYKISEYSVSYSEMMEDGYIMTIIKLLPWWSACC